MSFPSRRSYTVLALLSAAFVLYGSLVPLDFAAVPLEDAMAEVEAFLRMETARLSRIDFLTNVALLVPFGFLAMGALRAADRGQWAVGRAWVVSRGSGVDPLIVMGLSVVIALAAELSQIFFPDRSPSMLDVVAQMVGAAIGVLGWYLAGRSVTTWLRALDEERDLSQRATRLVGLVVAVEVVMQLMPLDLTIRPEELAAKYREGRLVLVPALPSGLGRIPWADWFLSAVLQVPVGILAVLAWTPRGRRRRLMDAAALGVGAVAGLELLQVFVWSRHAETLDVLTGAAGMMIGAAGTALVWDRRHQASSGAQRWSGAPAPPSSFHSFAFIGGAVWIVSLAAYAWAPFDFVVDAQIARARVPELLSVPFASQYAKHPLDAQAEVLTKLLFPLVLGVLLRLAVRWTSGACALGLLVLAGLEIGQLFLPSRYPDVTDVLLGGVAVWLGARLVTVVAQGGTSVHHRAHRTRSAPTEPL